MKKFHFFIITSLCSLLIGSLNFFYQKESSHVIAVAAEKKITPIVNINPTVSQVNCDNSCGYTTLAQEIVIDKLSIKGKVPTWLKGSLFRNGPAQFELGKFKFKHWFDGFAMIHRFTFENGSVSYANKFLDSNYRKKAYIEGKLPDSITGQAKPKSFFSKFSSLFAKPPIYDNTNINITLIGNQLAALTETPFALTFNPITLETTGPLSYKDKLDGHICTAHPHIDSNSGELFNILTQFGNTSNYQLYKISKNNTKRILIASLPTKYPSYIHSFAITEQFIILPIIPFVVNPFDLLFSNKPFLHNFKWEPKHGTKFIVLNKADGSLVGKYKTDAFFTFHQVNAYEKNNTIIMDLIAYNDSNVIANMSLEKLKSCSSHKSGLLKRYTIDLKQKTIIKNDISDICLESPSINYEYYNGKPYSCMYAVTADNTQLLKINVDSGDTLKWSAVNCFPGEPIFVSNPKKPTEDDGVILSVVLDGQKKQSFLLMLDASNFKELGRAALPHHIPFGFHGNFYQFEQLKNLRQITT
ncbi:MAG: carotenoid oxygenase family protein [Candidatus Babeliales bacterium]